MLCMVSVVCRLMVSAVQGEIQFWECLRRNPAVLLYGFRLSCVVGCCYGFRRSRKQLFMVSVCCCLMASVLPQRHLCLIEGNHNKRLDVSKNH